MSGKNKYHASQSSCFSITTPEIGQQLWHAMQQELKVNGGVQLIYLAVLNKVLFDYIQNNIIYRSIKISIFFHRKAGCFLLLWPKKIMSVRLYLLSLLLERKLSAKV